MPDAPVAKGPQGKVTFVLVKRGFQTLRFRVRIAGLSVPEAIKRIVSMIDYPFFGSFMVRERGKGGPENEYRRVYVGSAYVLTVDDILMAVG